LGGYLQKPRDNEKKISKGGSFRCKEAKSSEGTTWNGGRRYNTPQGEEKIKNCINRPPTLPYDSLAHPSARKCREMVKLLPTRTLRLVVGPKGSKGPLLPIAGITLS